MIQIFSNFSTDFDFVHLCLHLFKSHTNFVLVFASEVDKSSTGPKWVRLTLDKFKRIWGGKMESWCDWKREYKQGGRESHI